MKKLFYLSLFLMLTCYAVYPQNSGRERTSNRAPRKCICDDAESRNGICEHQDRRCGEGNTQGRGYGRGGHNYLTEKEREENRKIIQQLKSQETDFGEFETFSNEETGDTSFIKTIILPVDSLKLIDSLSPQSESGDDFGEFMPVEQSTLLKSETENQSGKHEGGNFKWVLAALLATVLTGILVKYKATRKFRIAFLVASIVIFGFYLGGCPCPISSLHNVVLAGLGVDRPWYSLIWFLGLIPITYLFGKTWCGWVCHLGGLQELIYRPGKWNFLKSENAQKTFKWIRISLLVILLVQIAITRSNLFKEIDPFKAAFNLYPANLVTWILLILLIVSSIFIYRPFCRSVCPVGLILGWISKIPGASVLDTSASCNSCSVCHKNCTIGAITRDKGISKLNNAECIRCGECIDACKSSGLRFYRKNESHKMVASCKNVA